MGSDGTPTGFLKEQAATYVRSLLDNENLYTIDMAVATMAKIQNQLLSEGYTMYLDGYSSYFFNDVYYRAVQQFEQSGDMHFVLGLTYEIDSWMNLDDKLSKAVDVQKYASEQVKPNWIKFFMDGTVESGTGFIDPVYLDGQRHRQLDGRGTDRHYAQSQCQRRDNAHTRARQCGRQSRHKCNINGGRNEMCNTIVHLRNVNATDYKRMADKNIYVTSGMLWHHNTDETAETLKTTLPASMADKGYPMKLFFDNGVPVSFHTNYPALSNSPDDPFGVMEIALTGVYHAEGGAPWWTDELITREQALTALTIGCARQMFIEQERGSISPGKFADFLLVNKDVLTCPVIDIHNAKPAATYFEGQKVFAI